jgi:Holliday junction resolvasome RuvABC endonuclease subunit
MKKHITIGLDLSYNSTGICFQEITPTGTHYSFFNIVPKKSKHSKNIQQIVYPKVTPPKEPTYTEQDMSKILNCHLISSTIRDLIKSYHDYTFTVNMEGNVFTTNGAARLVDLTMLNTIVKLELTKLESIKELYVFAPSNVKKVFTGKGNASKDLMISTFTDKYPDFDTTGKIDDLVDAYALCQCDGHNQPKIIPKPRKKKK